MKTNSILLAVAALGLAAGITLVHAQSKKHDAVKEFMRDKLELSQKVLAGLCTEDFDLITAKSEKLSAMSQEVTWQVFQNPRYEVQSAEFRRHVDALTRAAKDHNLDAATLAYVKTTMSCVECHKLVRGKLLAFDR